jgi:hypothetical protein
MESLLKNSSRVPWLDQISLQLAMVFNPCRSDCLFRGRFRLNAERKTNFAFFWSPHVAMPPRRREAR